jgi:tetratricopeptide (TPR) repeat protein
LKIYFWFSNVSSRALTIGVLLSCFSVSISFSQQTAKIDSLKEVILKAKDDSSSLKAYLLWGELIYEQYPDSAFFFWEKVRVLSKTKLTSKRPIYKKVYSTACFNIGWYYYVKSNIKLAIEYYLISKSLFEELHDYLGQGSVLNNLGLVYQSYQKDYSRALKLYYQALYFFKRVNEPANEAMAYNNIASVYRDMGDSMKALSYYKLSCEVSRGIKDLNGEVKVLFSIATIEYETGNKEKAKQSLERCIRISSEIDDNSTLSGSLTSLGYIYLQEKNFEKAFEYASKALEVAKPLGFPMVTKRAAKVLMKVHVQRKQWNKAFEMQELYFQMRDSIENVDKKSELTRQQLQNDYDKQAFADSIKYKIEQKQKDVIITAQQTKIENARIVRNSIIFISALLLLSGWLFYNRYTLRLIQKQNKLQIASLETQQKLLRALMNPHFLFNSINSIQSLIVENEPRLARDYLVKFSQLMRFILEHSRKSHISLQEEIESLKLYIEMEQLRFNDSFSFEIITSGLTINHEIRIPPLLVQPFVENAIIHGIRHKKGKGKISIEFRLADHSLECFIQDDGVGRMKAAEINENQRRSGRSMATELAENRLKSMSSKVGQIGSIRIDDLKDDHRFASGTRVEVIIPYVTFG